MSSLSRRPALQTAEDTIDPTLRDPMENGMESTRAQFTRLRRKFPWAITYITPADKAILDAFVQTVVYGAEIFTFTDPRDSTGNTVYTVRFSQVPKYRDAGWVDGFYRQNCAFEITEV
jgi:hypothetical protein